MADPTKCAVDVDACVGLDEDEFIVFYAATAEEIHFCKVHGLAAEALCTYGGIRGVDLAELLRRLETHRERRRAGMEGVRVLPPEGA